MSDIYTEHEGGDQSGTHGREGTETGDASRQSGRFRRRIAIAIAGVGAAVAALAAPQVVYTNEPYAENLQHIRAQSFRNTNHDGSPFRDMEQDELPTAVGGGLVDTNRAAYLGNPNGNPEQSFPVTHGGQFRVSCEFSHFSYDDPILFPRQPGAAHLHMFYGNTDVNAYSTYDTLIDSGSGTCNGAELNRTGYWAPAMIDPTCDLGGACVRIPERIVVYYKGEGIANANGAFAPATGSALYPRKLANIANVQPNPGNGISVPEWPNTAGGELGGGFEVNYKCTSNFSGGNITTGVNTIPTCDGDYYINTFSAPYPATRTVLELDIKFWNCFPNGGNVEDWTLWQPAGAGNGGWFYGNCDGSGGGNPTAATIYPHLSTFVNYVVMPGEDTSDWFLSSDVTPGFTVVGQRGSTLHSDWWGGWHQTINQTWLDECTNFSNNPTPSGCGFGYLSDGGPNGGSPTAGPALTYRPQYDTVGDANSYRVPLQTIFTELCVPLGPAHTYTTAASGALCL